MLKKANWEDLLKNRLSLFQTAEAQAETNQLHRHLVKANERIDQLNDKLNWLRTLVRVGDLTQLQDLVRKGKI